MPWEPRYSKEQAEAAIASSATWAETLDKLGCGYHGKNVRTLRKWAERWGISTAHLPEGAGGRAPAQAPYTRAEAAAAIGAARSWAEVLRRLTRCPSGGNHVTLRRRAAQWGISSAHFDPYAASAEALQRPTKPLGEVLLRGSSYSRSSLKRRLFEEGLKRRRCELCGQSEIWRGRRMGLILDHVNGIRDDNRLENLRIVCPNCAATLDTHCGRRNARPQESVECARCGTPFFPGKRGQRYCSRYCGSRSSKGRSRRRGSARKVQRPPYEQLLEEIEQHGYLGVGRRYGVSDNAVRKWAIEYARERAVAEGRDPSVVEIPTRTWPNRRERKAA